MGQADGGFSLIHSNDLALSQEQMMGTWKSQAWGTELSSNPLPEEEGNTRSFPLPLARQEMRVKGRDHSASSRDG